MAKKDNTADEKNGEALDKRVTRLEAIVRKILKGAEIHWGEDIDGDGNVGGGAKVIMLLLALGLALAGFVFAADEDIFVLRPSIDEPNATVKASSDGTSGKWTSDKLVVKTNAQFMGIASFTNTVYFHGIVNGGTY